MRIFRYWSPLESIISHAGTAHKVRCFGGSDASAEAALEDARHRVDRVAARIRGDALVDGAYQADIREEPLVRIDPHNVITRNRYGAEVLNSEDHVFVDIDQPRYRFWEIFSWTRDDGRRKARIVAFLERRAKDDDLRGIGMRVYETHKGIRVLVGGGNYAPRDSSTRRLMRSLNADRLYAILCEKQGCFRARLTPKPYRLRCQTHRVEFPRDAQAEAELQQWVALYDGARVRYSTCRYLKTIGPDFSDAVVQYHDRCTGAFDDRKLA